MFFSRSFTSVIVWCLDNLVPPIIRDQKWFLWPFLYVAYGKSTPLFFTFRKEVLNGTIPSDKTMEKYYEGTKNAPLNSRGTDLNRKSLEFVLDHIVGDSVLDAGCGRGYLAQRIADKHGVAVTAMDFVEPAKEQDAGKAAYTFVRGDVVRMPFADRSFDTVVCTHTLEHVYELKEAILELVRVADKRVIIVVPRQREYRYSVDFHIHFFPYEYRLRDAIGIPDATYVKLGNDFGCVIERK